MNARKKQYNLKNNYLQTNIPFNFLLKITF